MDAQGRAGGQAFFGNSYNNNNNMRSSTYSPSHNMPPLVAVQMTPPQLSRQPHSQPWGGGGGGGGMSAMPTSHSSMVPQPPVHRSTANNDMSFNMSGLGGNPNVTSTSTPSFQQAAGWGGGAAPGLTRTTSLDRPGFSSMTNNTMNNPFANGGLGGGGGMMASSSSSSTFPFFGPTATTGNNNTSFGSTLAPPAFSSLAASFPLFSSAATSSINPYSQQSGLNFPAATTTTIAFGGTNAFGNNNHSNLNSQFGMTPRNQPFGAPAFGAGAGGGGGGGGGVISSSPFAAAPAFSSFASSQQQSIPPTTPHFGFGGLTAAPMLTGLGGMGVAPPTFGLNGQQNLAFGLVNTTPMPQWNGLAASAHQGGMGQHQRWGTATTTVAPVGATTTPVNPFVMPNGWGNIPPPPALGRAPNSYSTHSSPFMGGGGRGRFFGFPSSASSLPIVGGAEGLFMPSSQPLLGHSNSNGPLFGSSPSYYANASPASWNPQINTMSGVGLSLTGGRSLASGLVGSGYLCPHELDLKMRALDERMRVLNVPVPTASTLPSSNEKEIDPWLRPVVYRSETYEGLMVQKHALEAEMVDGPSWSNGEGHGGQYRVIEEAEQEEKQQLLQVDDDEGEGKEEMREEEAGGFGGLKMLAIALEVGGTGPTQDGSFSSSVLWSGKQQRSASFSGAHREAEWLDSKIAADEGIFVDKVDGRGGTGRVERRWQQAGQQVRLVRKSQAVKRGRDPDKRFKVLCVAEAF